MIGRGDILVSLYVSKWFSAINIWGDFCNISLMFISHKSVSRGIVWLKTSLHISETSALSQVELTGHGSDLDQQGDASIRFLGYCPQENVLWPSLTTREHLEVVAAVKGLRRADARVAISRYCAPMRLL